MSPQSRIGVYFGGVRVAQWPMIGVIGLSLETVTASTGERAGQSRMIGRKQVTSTSRYTYDTHTSANDNQLRASAALALSVEDPPVGDL